MARPIDQNDPVLAGEHLAQRELQRLQIRAGTMNQHDRRTGRVARAKFDDVERRARPLDAFSLLGIAAFQDNDTGLCDQRQHHQRGHENERDHCGGPEFGHEGVTVGPRTGFAGPKACYVRIGDAKWVFHRAAPARQQSSYNRHWQLSITLSSTFAVRSTRPSEFSEPDFSTQSTATRGASKGYHGKIGGFSMNSRPNE